MTAAAQRMQLDAAAVVDGDAMQLALTLHTDAPVFALVRDAQGQPAMPWLLAIEPRGALVWFGHVRVPDGWLSAAPMLPRGEHVAPPGPWQRRLTLPLPLRENAVARDRGLERARARVTKVLVGIQAVRKPAHAPVLDPRSGSWALGADDKCDVAWAWVALTEAIAIDCAILSRPLPAPANVLGMIDHALPPELRRVGQP